MTCPCENPKTGEVIEVSAKTKEMVYRVQAPNMQEAIKKEIISITLIASFIITEGGISK